MASSPLEKTSADLKVARFVVHKLGETFDSFQVHSCSIFSLVEQWRNLQASFGEVNKSLESRVKELESKEREIGVVATKLQNFKEEVELGRKKLEFGEKSLSEKAAKVESRRNELKKWLEMIDVQQRGISEREKVVEVKERELADGLMRVKAVDEEEVRVSKLVEELETREKQIELRENRVDERFKAVELRENRVDERFKELELRGREVKVREEALEVKETELNEDIRAMEAKRSQLMKDQQALDLREEGMDKLYSLVELRENEINERFKAVESKEKELALREEDTKVLCEELKSKEKVIVERLNKLKVLCEELKSKEKDIVERLNTLKVEEKNLRDDCRALEEKKNEFNVRFASLEVRGGEVDSRSRDVEVKERDVNVQRVVLEAKEGALNGQWKMLEVKGKEIDERGKGLELKEKELEELRRGLELKEKQMNASFHGLQVKQMQMDERCKEMEVRETEICERYKEMEVREREICADKLDLKGKQMADGEKHGVEPQQSNKCGNNLVVDSNGSEGGFKTFLSINGKALQLYLNERFNHHESMKGEVFKMLKSMSNPAEIVLDAVDGFFAPHMTKDGVEFETSVVRSSCLLLLEQLMNLKPVDMKAVKREATIVAVKWRAKMKALEEIEVVVLAFLLLLVTYNLNNFLKKNELRRLCGLVDQHKLAEYFMHQRLGVLKRTNGSSGSKGAIKEAIQSDIVHITDAKDSSSAKTPGDIHSACRSMDEIGVRSYLIEHVKEHDVLQDKIVDALRYAPDAAKLILNVCNICVTDQDKNRADVNNTVIIFVLKQLMKLSPSISPEVTTEAKNFADFLKARLKGTNSAVLNYRFLQFLASYKLSNSYHPDELFLYFEVFYFGVEVYRPDENAYLCFALGLAKKIPGIIKNLIDRKKQLSAVKYICVFKLERTFPPVPLLEAYWESVQNKVNEKRKEGIYKDKCKIAGDSNLRRMLDTKIVEDICNILIRGCIFVYIWCFIYSIDFAWFCFGKFHLPQF
ncbi:hypothetical protein RND81_09G222300 [Saponaria officinalis]|uniref:FRIGIDA-like protein n=1 Tax=Saponaria officinalis TaxID=3572 RepID=A0AAW1IR47_SAPOF